MTDVSAAILDAITGLRAEFGEMRADIATLKTDVATLKLDVALLETSVAALAGSVAALEADVASLKAGLAALTSRVERVEADVAEIRRRAEAQPDLRLIGEQLKLLIERVGEMEKKSVLSISAINDFARDSVTPGEVAALHAEADAARRNAFDHEARLRRLEHELHL